MLIPYSAFYALITRYLVPKSLIGIIKDCYSSFDESIETATRIEDYHYLNNMVSKKEENEIKEGICTDLSTIRLGVMSYVRAVAKRNTKTATANNSTLPITPEYVTVRIKRMSYINRLAG